MATRVLIVDDDRDTADFLKLLVEPRGDLARTASDAAQAREVLRSWRPEVVLMDLMLPDADGIDLLKDFKEASPETQVIMVTGYGSVPKAVEAMKAGAFSFIEKPVDADVLLVMLDKATEKLQLSAENKRLKEELRDHTSFANIVARSDKMRQLFHLIKSVAPTDASVLIHGENGTGKELVASAIHEHSKRKKGPFIKINCAALPSELIESELFGHKRGAFTGAVSDKTGLMELADGGSLLLDEIGEMPASLQVKLLRVLQDREFRPVGGSRVIQPNFRLICATNVNLDAALGEGKLREDLYFRINTVTLAIPPLRDRTEDILLLAEHFLDRFSGQHQRNIRSIKPEAAKALLRYRWPGNVRELEHVIERAVIVAEGTDIMLDDLPPTIRDAERLPNQTGFVIPPHHTLEEIEKLAILQTLERTRGNKRKAASILGVYRPTLYNKLKKYNLLETQERTPRPAPAAPPPVRSSRRSPKLGGAWSVPGSRFRFPVRTLNWNQNVEPAPELEPLRRGRFTAQQREHFSGDVARIGVRGEEHKGRRDLFGLRRSFHRRVRTEPGDLVRLFVRGVERRPDRSRRHAIHPNFFVHEVLSQRLGERMNRAFCRGIVEELFAALEARY